MSNVIIKIQDLIHPFKSWYETLKQEYEKELLACITYEEWQRILQDLFRGDLHQWLRVFALAAKNEENNINWNNSKEENNIDWDNSKNFFFSKENIKYEINSLNGNISFKSNTSKDKISDLSPVCIGLFRNDKGESIAPNIEKLIACFNASSSSKRVFNEVHYTLPGDPDLTLSFGHFANENLNSFFKEMPENILTEMCSYIKFLLLKNSNDNKKGPSYINQFWGEPIIKDFIKNECENEYENKHIENALKHFLTNGDLASWAKNLVEGKNDNGYEIPRLQTIMHDTYIHQELIKEEKKTPKYSSIINYNNEIYKENKDIINKKYPSSSTEKSIKELEITIKKLEETEKILASDIKEEPFIKNLKEYNSKILKYIQLIYKIKKLDKSKLAKLKNPKYLQLDLFPGEGKTKEDTGFWFYDTMRKALLLKKVCYWQVEFWIKKFIKSICDNKNATSDAIIAIMSSWKSTGSLDWELHLYNRVGVDNGSKIIKSDIKSELSNLEKAVLYWNNYNILKSKIRYRNGLIWKCWIEPIFESQTSVKNSKEVDNKEGKLEFHFYKDNEIKKGFNGDGLIFDYNKNEQSFILKFKNENIKNEQNSVPTFKDEIKKISFLKSNDK